MPVKRREMMVKKLKEFQVTVRMIKLEEHELEDTITVMAEDETDAESKVEDMDVDNLDTRTDCAKNSYNECWQYSCLYSQELESVDAMCMEPDEVEEEEPLEMNDDAADSDALASAGLGTEEDYE